MQNGCVAITETASEVRLLKINGYSLTAIDQDACSKSRWNVDGYDWEIHFFPAQHILRQEWVQLKLILISEPRRCNLNASLRSPVFMAEFFSHMKEARSALAEVVDMEAAAFKAMLHFIYTDTVPELDHQQEASATMAMHLLAAADRYGLDRLKMSCEDKLSSGIDIDTVATTLALAEQLGCSLLKAKCVEFITKTSENLDAVMATEGFKHLEVNYPSVLRELLKAACGSKSSSEDRCEVVRII
ncbi:hypothetical protein E2562_017281 [Oryza meyeriana var. granulata]|uniref:BTB domain-containing protein n=1 Tax=Oryza meyeriana var. granulata TaxID=110450 RepID=A0A6G1ELJ6_9ORYZ|nr:hypothetical protein E2562_017281 [Oryza meyeriana var. granulata]